MKKAIIRTFQAVFTIAILIWLFHSPEKRAQMAGAISKADRIWLEIGLPVALIGEVANIVRWQILMRVQGMYMSWRRAIESSRTGTSVLTASPRLRGLAIASWG